MRVKEIWNPKAMSASGTLVREGGSVGGFLCTSSTSGTLQITAGIASGGADVLASMSVTAGTYYPLGYFAQSGLYAVLTNAAGTFTV